jgi:hypothetical protein
MRRTHLICGLVIAVVAIVAVSGVTHAGKYSRPKPHVVGAGGEMTTSMSDCMSFCSSFPGGSRGSSKAMFNKQFGAPASTQGRVYTYNYDSYTKIILDCSGGCYARCMQ